MVDRGEPGRWKQVRVVSPRLWSLLPGESATDGSIDLNHAGGPPRLKSLIGYSPDGREVWYDPDLPQGRLANGHIVITGTSGTGKTQCIKSIVADLQALGAPVLALDFKDDYSQPDYARAQGFSVYDPTIFPLPVNPLFPVVDPQSGRINLMYHAYQIADILARIYGLGELQAFRLREAIKQAYVSSGLSLAPGSVFSGSVPSFDTVRDILAVDKDNAEILGRLAAVFDFGLFSATDARNFEDLANQNSVIRLTHLPSNEIKNAVAEFFLMALYNFLVRLPQTNQLSRALVLDEAWRLVQSPFLEPLMREGRAFGLGVLVASQFPTDLPLVVSGSAATQLFFAQTSPSQIAEIERIVSGSVADEMATRIGDLVRSLPPLNCLMRNKHYEPYILVKVIPYFSRLTKTAELVPFPPEEEDEGANPFAQIYRGDYFIRSPRNRRRLSKDA